jgi:hypothetical protein
MQSDGKASRKKILRNEIRMRKHGPRPQNQIRITQAGELAIELFDPVSSMGLGRFLPELTSA